jgi:hypothetical protein
MPQADTAVIDNAYESLKPRISANDYRFVFILKT